MRRKTKALMRKKSKWRKGINTDLLLKFYVNRWGWRFGNHPKCSFRKNNGSTMPGRPRNWTECTINDPYLNCLAWNASSRVSRAYAPHQILPPTCSTIVPYPLAGRREEVAWRELCCIVSIAGCGCVKGTKKT